MAGDDEQHADAFNMDADYEGLVEAGGEFFFAARKAKRQQTREEALYGYQSSDSDDGGGGRRGGKRSKKADYSKPVGFVSSGVIQQQPDDDKPQPAAATQPPKQQQREQAANGSTGGLGFGGGAAGLGFGGSSGSGPGGSGSGSSTAGLGSGGGGGGLGFVPGGGAGGGGGLGFKSAGTTQQQQQQQQQGLGASGMLRHPEQQQAEDDEAGVLPSAFGRKIKAAAEAKQQQRAAQAAAVAHRSAARAANHDIGAFEAHTKGIGLKLLAKMGFTPGQGLGRNKQGIAKPLEAKLRPKGAGMGYGGFQEAKMVVDTPASLAEAAAAKAAAAASDPDAVELEGELAAATAKLQAPLWKKKAAPARQRRSYRTAEDVLEEAAGGGGDGGGRPGGGVASQPILDLRGPQARLVTDLEQLNAVQDDGAGVDAGPPMPELHHNLGLLVSLTEAQLRRLDAALQHQQDTAALLAQEKQRLAKEAAAAAAASDRLAGLTARLAHVRQLDGALSLGQLREEYGAMAASYPDEFTLFSLAAAALAQVLPRMRRLMSGWQPLSQPQLGAAEAAAWRPLLESDAARGAVLRGPGGWADSGDPFATLVAEVVLPPVRSAITQWEPRQPEPLLAWFDTWAPVLPRGATQQLLTGLVLPRIAAAVEGWDPTRETQPIHAWLHPWLPYLAAELAGVYPIIRHRLSRALTAWHASDGSARVLLAPWSKVFEPQDWEALMARAIVPKLAQALQTELVLHPLEPQLEPLEWALAWAGLLPLNQLAALLEAAFFPAWLAILHHWLSAAPDFDEVTRWYLEWKGRLPQELLDHPRVRSAFATALNMMNAAADGQPLPPPSSLPAGASAAGAAAAGAGARSVPAWRREVEADAAAAAGAAGAGGYGQPPPATSAAAAGASGPEPSLRELVGRYASEAGIEFLPRAGRLHDGLPVYAFGGVSCVVDRSRGVIRAQLKDRGWVPVSLERLKAEAQAKAGGG